MQKCIEVCLSTFAAHNLRIEAYRKPSSRLDADMWKVEFAAMLDPGNLTEFVDSWFPGNCEFLIWFVQLYMQFLIVALVRDYWRKSMHSSATRTCEKILHFALCLEQNALLLHKNLDFDSACRLFSDRTLVPYPFQKLDCGDIVVYDCMRHEYALKIEKQKCSANRAEMTRNSEQVKSLQSSMIWLGDLPRANKNGGRIREFQVYLVQYFPGNPTYPIPGLPLHLNLLPSGGGEPYAVLTLGPKPGVGSVADTSRPSIVHGRGRTTRFCKMPKCSVYAIDGNFGFCEDHRYVALAIMARDAWLSALIERWTRKNRAAGRVAPLLLFLLVTTSAICASLASLTTKHALCVIPRGALELTTTVV